MIGGPLAAFVLLGNDISAMSHQTVVLPLTQALAYLEQENIHATITRFSEVKATIHDYVFRTMEAPHIEATNFWDFTLTQEICKLKSCSGVNPVDNDESHDDEAPEPASGRTFYKFSHGHPQRHTQGHRARMTIRWTQYLAKRLPDLRDLDEDRNLLDEETRNERNAPRGSCHVSPCS
jgi:hypothetical protein